jgi:hypothetical protein
VPDARIVLHARTLTRPPSEFVTTIPPGRV